MFFSFQATASYSPNFIQVAQGRGMEQHGSRWIMTKHSAFCLESFTLRRCATIWPQRWYGEVVAGSCHIVLLYNLLFVAEARVIIRSHWHPMISIYFGCHVKIKKWHISIHLRHLLWVRWCSMRQRCVSVSSGVTFWSQVGGVSNADLADATEVAKALQPWEATDSRCRLTRCDRPCDHSNHSTGSRLMVFWGQRRFNNWSLFDFTILLISCLLSLSTLMTQRKYRTNMFAQRPSQYYVLFWKSILSKESKSVKSLENMSEP